jgi:hypothetical protein
MTDYLGDHCEIVSHFDGKWEIGKNEDSKGQNGKVLWFMLSISNRLISDPSIMTHFTPCADFSISSDLDWYSINNRLL